MDPFTSHAIGPATQHLHLGMVPVAGDTRGMSPDALAQAVRAAQGKIKAVFLLPGGAGPEARVMDHDRRAALAEVAQAEGIAIIECDPLGPLHVRSPAPIASLAPKQTFYVTGLSKVLAPGLRLGFLMVPDAAFEVTVNRHTSVSWMATPLVAEIAADWIANGTADALLAAQRAELATRNRTARLLLSEICTGAPHGLHRWMPLSYGADEAEVVVRLADHGIAVTPGAQFAVGEQRGRSASVLEPPSAADWSKRLR